MQWQIGAAELTNSFIMMIVRTAMVEVGLGGLF
jgi:hypothetical protein